jgi:hypothetical protein
VWLLLTVESFASRPATECFPSDAIDSYLIRFLSHSDSYLLRAVLRDTEASLTLTPRKISLRIGSDHFS